MAKTQTGRQTIFGKRDPKSWIRGGNITKIGKANFEQARTELAALYLEVMGVPWATVSESDALEYVLRGKEAARAFLLAKRP